MSITDTILRRGETVYGNELIRPVTDVADTVGKTFHTPTPTRDMFREFNATSDRVDCAQTFLINGTDENEFPSTITLDDFVQVASDNDLRLLYEAAVGKIVFQTVIITPDDQRTYVTTPYHRFISGRYITLVVNYNHSQHFDHWNMVDDAHLDVYSYLTMGSTTFHTGVSKQTGYFNPMRYYRWVIQQPRREYAVHRVGSTILVDGVPLCQDQGDAWCMLM